MSEKKNLNVLLIEDNEGDAFLLKFYLGESETHAFTFDHAESLAAAFSNLRTQKYDIILMDLNLPDSKGLASIKDLLNEFPNNLVIVLTGLMDEKIGLDAVRYGAQDFLVKGRFDSKVLASSIIYAFERFMLNHKLAKATAEISAGFERFNNLQELTRIGYFEIDLETNQQYLSLFIGKILGFPEGHPISSKEVISLVENIEDVQRRLDEFILQRKSGSMPIKITHFKNPVTIKWEFRNNKLISAVYYPES